MTIRMIKAWDDGTITVKQGGVTDAFTPAMEDRLVQSGLAERETLDDARARVGMAPLTPPAEDIVPASIDMLRRELVELADALGVVIETDDNKADIVRKINEAA